MTPAVSLPTPATRLPDHNTLPFKDDAVSSDFSEHPQSWLLSSCLAPLLERLHPDNYSIGQDSFIYWEATNPPTLGAKAPDWFLILGVPTLLQRQFRKSYVLWQEHVRPLLVIEFVSGDGFVEHDTTPRTGKFWVYEQGIGARYYAIWDREGERLEVFELVQGRYQPMTANARGHFAIEPLAMELGIWHGAFAGMDAGWLRWWDAAGILALSGEERAEHLAAKLRALGIDPDKV
jgi:Uma2 family endonuclease